MSNVIVAVWIIALAFMITSEIAGRRDNHDLAIFLSAMAFGVFAFGLGYTIAGL